MMLPNFLRLRENRDPESDGGARAEILAYFTVGPDGRIRNPGKFEGEMLYVPHFYNAGLDGLTDTDDGRTWGFRITAEDRKEFPELGRRRKWVRIYERDDGFVVEV